MIIRITRRFEKNNQIQLPRRMRRRASTPIRRGAVVEFIASVVVVVPVIGIISGVVLPAIAGAPTTPGVALEVPLVRGVGDGVTAGIGEGTVLPGVLTVGGVV
jgi:hypothetical protein